jgi:protein transport protein SEC31
MQTLEGHSAGILSVSWCHLDHDLLLSCGKDNRTILWNPQTSKMLGEFPVASTWAFETQWCPQNPDILANATFEGKITIHRLQSTMPKSEVNGAQAGGEDFFSQRQYVSEGGFELKQAPKWLQVPCSASFGFGGSLVSVKNTKGKGEVKINKYVSEPKISENASEFEEAIRTADWTGFCEKQIDKASSDSERGNWELLRMLFDNEPKKKLIEYLGVKPTEVDELTEKVEAVKFEKADSELTVAEPETTNNNRLSRIFGSDTDFLSHLTPSSNSRTDPFSITSTTDSESDKLITQSILFGQFDQAVDICLKEDRLSDAFVLATLGDKSLQKKVQDAYFNKNVHHASYLRLLQSVVESNLWDVAEHAELSGWKQILVAVCTFAKTDDDFSGLCEALGQRLEREEKIEDAKVCYLAGKKLDRVVNIWIAEADTQEKEQLKTTQGDSAFSIHARALQGFVEKVTVFKQTKGTSTGDLKPLYDKYTEFVEIVASQGNLTVAQTYIDLLPGENDAVSSVKNRLSTAMAKPLPATPARTVPAATARAVPAATARRGLAPSAPTASTVPPAFPPNQYTPVQANPFAPSQYYPMTQAPAPAPPSAPPARGASQYIPAPSAPDAPVTTGPTSPYAPSQFTQYNPGLQPTNPVFSRVADLPPPPKKSGENWNDPPMLPNPIRTRTPVAPLVKPPSPFTAASPSASSGFQKSPPGPPPASAKPPQRVRSPPVTSPTIGAPQFPQRQTSFSQAPPSAAPPPGPPPSRPPHSTFTPPPTRTTQPPPPTGQFRAQSATQSRPQYAPSPMQQNSFPPAQTAAPSQYASPPSRQYAPAPAISPVEKPSTPPVKATPPQPKFRTSPPKI